MTRQEAIIQLRLGPGINEDVSEAYNDAVNVAIEALEQEPSEDCISRQDAIDALVSSSVYAWSTEEDQSAHEWALKIISELPAAERKTEP